MEREGEGGRERGRERERETTTHHGSHGCLFVRERERERDGDRRWKEGGLLKALKCHTPGPISLGAPIFDHDVASYTRSHRRRRSDRNPQDSPERPGAGRGPTEPAGCLSVLGRASERDKRGRH